MHIYLIVLFCIFFFHNLNSADLKTYKFLLIDIEDDLRYDKWGVHPVDIRSKNHIRKRSISGAKLSVQESKSFERLTKTKFTIDYLSVKNLEELRSFFIQSKNETYNTILLDLEEKYIKNIIEQIKYNTEQIFFNVSEPSNNLRKTACAGNLLHTYPSKAMFTDSIAQFLVEKKWTKVLMLTGPLSFDKKYSDSFKSSAGKFGIRVLQEKFFVDNNDPRIRDKNDLNFLTMEKKYNVIFVSDINGEFALKVPFNSKKPAVVTGSVGLTPKTWHWSYLRHGAPQLNGRFERMHQRRMSSRDWAAWMAVKVIIESVLRTKTTANREILNYIRDSDIRVDGSKGIGLNFRSETNQLRQTIFLVSGNNWVSGVAPFESFKNKTNDLDTLGILSNSCN